MLQIKNKLVIVNYQDPTTWSSWQNPEDVIFTAAECVSIGWVMEDTKQKLVIFGAMNDLGQISDVTVIPKGCIIKIRTIKVPAAV